MAAAISLCPSQVLALTIPMEIAVNVFTLHGTIVTIHVDPKELVESFKEKCIGESPFHLTPLKINADLVHLMRDCKIDNKIGKRVSTWDGQLLDEKETIESHVTTDTLLKLAFMKQYELDNSEREMAMTFYQAHGPSEIDVCMPQYGTH